MKDKPQAERQTGYFIMAQPDIHLHTNQLISAETTTRNGLPVTTVARTLADESKDPILGQESVVEWDPDKRLWRK